MLQTLYVYLSISNCSLFARKNSLYFSFFLFFTCDVVVTRRAAHPIVRESLSLLFSEKIGSRRRPVPTRKADVEFMAQEIRQLLRLGVCTMHIHSRTPSRVMCRPRSVRMGKTTVDQVISLRRAASSLHMRYLRVHMLCVHIYVCMLLLNPTGRDVIRRRRDTVEEKPDCQFVKCHLRTSPIILHRLQGFIVLLDPPHRGKRERRDVAAATI